MFGAGPGALPSDALMGIPVAKQRDRMDEVLCIVKLLRGNTVTHKSDWFELNNAHLQMTPFMRPSIARRAGSSARCTLPTLAKTGPYADVAFGFEKVALLSHRRCVVADGGGRETDPVDR